MVVVADTSPVNYLVLINEIEILPRLYTRILVPSAVLDELKHPVAPEPVRHWAAHPPLWLEVLTPKRSLPIPQLDIGESEAIALAIEMRAEVLLMDERAGRQEAVRHGLKVAGTLSVLDEADQGRVGRLRRSSRALVPDQLQNFTIGPGRDQRKAISLKEGFHARAPRTPGRSIRTEASGPVAQTAGRRFDTAD